MYVPGVVFSPVAWQLMHDVESTQSLYQTQKSTLHRGETGKEYDRYGGCRQTFLARTQSGTVPRSVGKLVISKHTVSQKGHLLLHTLDRSLYFDKFAYFIAHSNP